MLGKPEPAGSIGRASAYKLSDPSSTQLDGKVSFRITLLTTQRKKAEKRWILYSLGSSKRDMWPKQIGPKMFYR